MSNAQIQKYKYTNTQIHKYTNTAYDKVPERPNMWYIFEERIVQGYQKIYSHVPNAQIQNYKYKIHKYTNTAYDEVPERPSMWYIFEKRIVQGFQKLYSHMSNARIQKIKIRWKIIKLSNCVMEHWTNRLLHSHPRFIFDTIMEGHQKDPQKDHFEQLWP